MAGSDGLGVPELDEGYLNLASIAGVSRVRDTSTCKNFLWTVRCQLMHRLRRLSWPGARLLETPLLMIFWVAPMSAHIYFGLITISMLHPDTYESKHTSM
jgi:hypothetical protein